MFRQGPEGHWFLEGREVVRLDSGEVVTTMRAVHAAFLGPVPGDACVVSSCDFRLCGAPDHLKLRPSSRRMRPLDLSNVAGEQGRAQQEVAPKHGVAREVGRLFDLGNSPSQIGLRLNIPLVDVLKSLNS
jgi:hypothetical protein